jgi:hypothetical protein
MPARLGMAVGQGALSGLGGAEGSASNQLKETVTGGALGLAGGAVGEGIGAGIKGIGKAAGQLSDRKALEAVKLSAGLANKVLDKKGSTTGNVLSKGAEVKKLGILDPNPEVQYTNIKSRMNSVGEDIGNTKDFLAEELKNNKFSIMDDVLLKLAKEEGDNAASDATLNTMLDTFSRVTKGKDEISLEQMYKARDQMAKLAKYDKFDNLSSDNELARKAYTEINNVIDSKVAQQKDRLAELAKTTDDPEIIDKISLLEKYRQNRDLYGSLSETKKGTRALARKNMSNGGVLSTGVGAGIGATAGSVLGPLGAAAGASVGAVAGNQLNKIISNPVNLSRIAAKINKYSQISPDTLKILRGTRNGLTNLLMRYVNDEAFRNEVDAQD